MEFGLALCPLQNKGTYQSDGVQLAKLYPWPYFTRKLLTVNGNVTVI